MVNTNNRYFDIDIAKAISIFGVVYIHYGIPGDYFSSHLFRFGVPIFIIISFFLSEKNLLDRNIIFQTSNFLKIRIRRLLVPLLFWTIFYALTDFILGFKSSIEISPVFGWTGQYFFVVLIQLTLIYPFFRRFNFSFRNIISIILLTFVFVYFPFSYLKINIFFLFPKGEASFIFWINYMSLGIFLARNYEKINIFINKKKGKSIQLLVILFCSFLIFSEYMIFQNMSLNSFIFEPYQYSRISNFFVSVLIFLLCLSLKNISVENIFLRYSIENLSKWSLGIFCLNPFILKVLNILFDIYNLSIDNIILSIFIRFIVSILVCLIAIFISKFFYILNLKILVQ